MENVWKKKDNNTAGNCLSSNNRGKKSDLSTKKEKDVSLRNDRQLTGERQEHGSTRLESKIPLKNSNKLIRKTSSEVVRPNKIESDFHYSLSPKINVIHTKELIEKIKQVMKPGKYRISKVCKSLESDNNMECPKNGLEKNSKGKEIRFAPKNRHNKAKVIVVYKKHKRRNQPDSIGDTGEIQNQFSIKHKRDLRIHSERNLSKPRGLFTREICDAKKENARVTTPTLKFRSNSQIICARDASLLSETEKLSHSSKRLGRSKSSTDFRTESGRKLRQMADRKLNLHREMIRSLGPVEKKFSKSTGQANVLSQPPSRSYFFQKTSECPDIPKQNVCDKKINHQDLEKLLARSRPQVENSRLPSPSPKCHQAEMYAELHDKEEEIKSIYGVENEFVNAFSYKSTMPKESYWKNTILEPNGQNETESEKLSLLEKNLLNSNGSSQVEGLMSKLSKEIKKCSEYIQKLNEYTKESFKINKSVQSSSSDSSILRNDSKYEKTERDEWCTNLEHPIDPVWVYPLWKKWSKTESSSKPKRLGRKHSSHRKGKRCKHSKEHKLKPVQGKCLDFADHSTDSSTSICSRNKSPQQKEHSSKKCSEKTVEVFCCDDCVNLKRRIISLERKVEQIKQKILCCDSQNCQGVICHICEANIKNSKHCKHHEHCCHYHHPQQCQHQHQHHQCQHQHHQHQYYQNQQPKFPQQKNQNQQQQVAYYPVKTNSSTTIVQKSKNRDLHLKSSTSDCHLNVGMEITMENVDPVTGKKLGGEIRRDCQQEGNIQCRLFEKGQTPLLLMNTDFEYNPLTGMLFKNKESPKATSQSTSVVLPLKISEEEISMACPNKAFSKLQDLQQIFTYTNQMSDQVSGRKSSSRKCISLEQNHLGKGDRKHHSKENLFLERKNKRSRSLGRKHNNEEKTPCSNKSEKELKINLDIGKKIFETQTAVKEDASECEPHHYSTSCSPKSSKSKKPKKGKSQIPTRKKPTPSTLDRSTSRTSSSSAVVSTKSSVPEPYCLSSPKQWYVPKLKKSVQIIQKPFLKNAKKSTSTKTTQTYQKPVNVVLETEKNNMGIQTEISELQDQEIQTLVSPLKEVGVKEKEISSTTVGTITVEQTRNLVPEVLPKEPSSLETIFPDSGNVVPQIDKKVNSLLLMDIGLQTNLPNEEVSQYLNDLQIQKKVNLAIAELCFYLAKGENSGMCE